MVKAACGNLPTGRSQSSHLCDEPATYDEDGKLVTRPDENGTEREGWVEVHPCWAPEDTVKVCGFEAQTNRFAATVPTAASGRSQRTVAVVEFTMVCSRGVQRRILEGLGQSIELSIKRS